MLRLSLIINGSLLLCTAHWQIVQVQVCHGKDQAGPSQASESMIRTMVDDQDDPLSIQ